MNALSAVLAFLGRVLRLVPLALAWALGRAQRDRDRAEDALDAVERAARARDRVSFDPGYRERLRDRYRGG